MTAELFIGILLAIYVFGWGATTFVSVFKIAKRDTPEECAYLIGDACFVALLWPVWVPFWMLGRLQK